MAETRIISLALGSSKVRSIFTSAANSTQTSGATLVWRNAQQHQAPEQSPTSRSKLGSRPTHPAHRMSAAASSVSAVSKPCRRVPELARACDPKDPRTVREQTPYAGKLPQVFASVPEPGTMVPRCRNKRPARSLGGDFRLQLVQDRRRDQV
jgi:hypothetical protein